MFITKKSFRKILLMAILYFVLGSLLLGLGIILENLDAGNEFLFILGAVCYLLCPLIIVWGRYAEGKGKIANLGNKLVRTELKPFEFIEEYKRISSAADLVVNKPSIEVLHLLAIAYDCLDDRENCLCAADEMIAAASEKKKAFAKLIKSSFLFSYGMIEEAEVIFTEAQTSNQDFLCRALTDAILKSDRAMALGDYKTVEIYNLNTLAQTFPKPDNLTKLVIHFKLGEVYEKLQENEKAISYYKYCIDNGGETAIKRSAKNALEKIQ